MHSAGDNETHLPAANRFSVAAFEVAWIFLIFFLFAGSLPPDVGESHYLVKAKHYWQPEWCAGDLFVESRDAHATFNWVFGWVTRFCTLERTAWVGRVVTWLLLAWSWQRLSWAIVPRPLVSLLSAGFVLLLMRQMHLAGEWVVGGVEAKGFAYVLVFLALEAIAKSRWRAGLLFAGAAGAFHVLVGGWTAVAIGLAWLVSGSERPRLASIAPAAVGGLVLALPGLLPALALNAGAPSDVTREAARIYVFERLSHHLVFYAFSPGNIARFQLLVIGWAMLAWMQRKELTIRRLQLVVGGAVGLAIVGVVIDQALVTIANLQQQTDVDYQLGAARILRYYWFRMADSLVPVGLSLALVLGLSKLQSTKPALAAWLGIAGIFLAAANLADIQVGRLLQRVPPAILQPQPTADSVPRAWWKKHPKAIGETEVKDWYRDWVAVCKWIAAETPADALFLTPHEQQTFKWYAGRAEVANWKDVPQDARGLVEWKQRMGEVYPRERTHHLHDLAAFTDAELLRHARKYGAQYIVIDRTRARRPIGLPRLYPVLREDNDSFDVYRVPPQADP